MALIGPNKHQICAMNEELGFSEESIERDVSVLISWMERRHNLPSITDKTWLKHFLIRCKNSMEKAKGRLEAYYVLRSTIPEVYSNRDPFSPEIKYAFDALAFVPLPKLTEDGSRITVMKVFDQSAINKIQPESIIKAIYMSADLRVLIDNCRTDMIVYDFEGFTMPLVTALSSILTKFITLGTKGLPMRFNKLYIINLPNSAEILVSISKTLIKKELAERMVVLKNGIQDLKKEIHPDLLPKEYGGKLATLLELRDQWVDLLKSKADWFQEEEKYKADGPSKNHQHSFASDTYGIEGSFRKITID